MESNIFQVNKNRSINDWGIIKIIDPKLVKATVRAVEIISNNDKFIRIIIKQNYLIFTNKDESKEHLIYMIHINNERTKVEISNFTKLVNFSIIINSVDFYKNLCTYEELEGKITLDFQKMNDKTKTIILKIKPTSQDGNLTWSTKLTCNYSKEGNEFLNYQKEHIFRINASKIELFSTILKNLKTSYLKLLCYEKTLLFQLGQDFIYDLNSLTGDDQTFNYEKSFKEICKLKKIDPKDYSSIFFSFEMDIRKLVKISKSLFDLEDHFQVNYEQNKLHDNNDYLRIYYIQKKGESMIIEFHVICELKIDINFIKKEVINYYNPDLKSKRNFIREEVNFSNSSSSNLNSSIIKSNNTLISKSIIKNDKKPIPSNRQNINSNSVSSREKIQSNDLKSNDSKNSASIKKYKKHSENLKEEPEEDQDVLEPFDNIPKFFN